MMNTIVDLIEGKGWTQKEAAEHLNTTQQNISDIQGGIISKCSRPMLVKVLAEYMSKL